MSGSSRGAKPKVGRRSGGRVRLAAAVFLLAFPFSSPGVLVAGESPASESLPKDAADHADCGDWNTRPFFEAATSDDVEECLRSGADPASRDGLFGMTPLHYAVVCDNAAVVGPLVDAGADPNARDDWGWTPLHCAGHCPREVREHDDAVHVDSTMTEALIAVGADPGIQSPLGNTALHHAARGNANAAVVEVLTAAGADPNARNDDGRTPLHTAARFNHAAVVEALIEAGADPAARDSLFGVTPLHVVLRSPPSVRVLIAAGASVATVDRRGRTPLHTVAGLMVWEDGADVIRTMIAQGARVDARDDNGYAPLHVAATSPSSHAAAAVDALVRAEMALTPDGNVDSAGNGEVIVTARTQGEATGSEDLWAVGYFDEDRLADAAFFRRTAEGTYQLAALPSTSEGDVALAELESLADMGVRTLEPGTYVTACAKGAGPPCRSAADERAVLERDGILLFRYESSARLLYQEDGAFVSAWLSD